MDETPQSPRGTITVIDPPPKQRKGDDGRWQEGTGTQRNGGRKKGTPNKIPTLLKQAVIESFDLVGGVGYLAWLAVNEPVAYAALLGKVIGTQKDLDVNIAAVQRITNTIIDPAKPENAP